MPAPGSGTKGKQVDCIKICQHESPAENIMLVVFFYYAGYESMMK
jgi:hypothetical protein